MENYIDDPEAYQRLKTLCRCGCYAHCGHSCMTDDCDCNECACPVCREQYPLDIRTSATL
jgi:hypothetical protein